MPDTAVDGAGERGTAWSEHRLWAHVLLLTLVLAGLRAFVISDVPFTSDEGAYAIEARALDAGSWNVEYLLAESDPEGKHVPFVNAERTPTGFATYVKQPAYVEVLAVAYGIAGAAGLAAVPIAGAVAAATAAWLLAAALHLRGRALAFWLAAGSPVVVGDAFMLWAHSWSAAFAGFSALAAAHLLGRSLTSRGEVFSAVGLAVALAGGVLLRSEGFLWASALCAALLVAGARARRWRLAGIAMAAGAAAIAAFEVSDRWTKSLVRAGDHTQGLDTRSVGDGLISGRVKGAVFSLLHHPGAAWGVVVIVAFALACIGCYQLRRRDLDAGGWAMLGGAAACIALAAAFGGKDGATGLFAAWPIALLGLVARRWEDRSEVERSLLIGVALFAAAVLATQYAEGGSLQWGGRFLSPLVIVVAVASAAAVSDLARASVRPAPAVVGALALASAVLAITSTDQLRRDNASSLAAIHDLRPAVVLTSNDFGALIDWRAYPSTAWVSLADDDRDATAVADLLRRAGVHELVAADIPVGALNVPGLHYREVAPALYVVTLD